MVHDNYTWNFILKNVAFTFIFIMQSTAVYAIGTPFQVYYDYESQDPECEKLRSQYTFSWQFIEDCDFLPRGGQNNGPDVEMDDMPSEAWLALQETGLTKFQKDRMAILAMEGPYRVSFDFLETQVYQDDLKPSRPYQTWATEYVYVVEERMDFISLQHILVLFYIDQEGNTQGPVLTKHWRQDWQYQRSFIFSYIGNFIWKRDWLNFNDIQGNWVQTVYQVDDSLRYSSYGRWHHSSSFSSWESAKTWRPLPRREFSVRNDYQVLTGINRHTITPKGWIHEQENYKTQLNDDGSMNHEMPHISKEIGLNRYARIKNFDFSGGHEYWENTQKFWSNVRDFWDKTIKFRHKLALHPTIDNTPIYIPLFSYAEKINNYEIDYDEDEAKTFIESTITPYIIIQ